MLARGMQICQAIGSRVPEPSSNRWPQNLEQHGNGEEERPSTVINAPLDWLGCDANPAAPHKRLTSMTNYSEETCYRERR